MSTVRAETRIDRPEGALTYEIKRTPRRRSISIEVREARVIVRAPMGATQRYLDQLVQERQAWILDKIHTQQQLLATVPQRRYEAGEQLPYLGRELTLVLATGPRAHVSQQGHLLQVIRPQRSRLSDHEQTRRLVVGWYRVQALQVLTEKTQVLAQRMGLQCREVNIRATRSKWGHCTSTGAIQYNGQIMLAPESIVDYLVAHEVSHLRHHNHGPAFWALVASVCPDYRDRRAWLKSHGLTLVL